ncbi:MAG: type I restriction enzyme HsdR N-terminal domain-containing protein [Flavobacteriia bacterium]|nr:type I restriction enzyme HsdR N-terminal domain-containing protein [Flavobacteriia bacterium]
MHALSLPKANLKLSKKGDLIFVWCIARKKTLLLSPEEWVRQHVIHYLVNHLRVPLGLIASEYSLKINKLSRRCDIVVFSKNNNPVLLVECKSVDVALNEKIFHQIAQYNFKLSVDYLMMTNGIHHVFCKIDRANNQLIYLENLPQYDELN